MNFTAWNSIRAHSHVESVSGRAASPSFSRKSDKSENEKEGEKSGNLAEEPERAETNSPGWGVFCEPITSLRLALQDARMAGSLCPGALMPTEYE